MGCHPGWAVWAAILIVDYEIESMPVSSSYGKSPDFHYDKDIAKRVYDTGLSNLGRKSKATMDKTLRSQIAKKKMLFGGGYGDSFYWLNDVDLALSNSEVKAAMRDYLSWLERNSLKTYWNYYAERNNRLLAEAKEEIVELKKRIDKLES